MTTDGMATVFSISVASDGQTVASGGADGITRQWQISDGILLRAFGHHTGGVASVAFAPDGLTFASGSYDFTATLWDPPDGTDLHTLVGHTDVVNAVGFSPDSQRPRSPSL
jgi:WD40 repeat protein